MVEVPCTVTADGPVPVTGSSVPPHGVELVRRVKATERAVLEAAASGSRAVAVRAMASHPLIDSVPLARRLIDDYRAALPGAQLPSVTSSSPEAPCGQPRA